MEEYIKLATGKIYEVTNCGSVDDALFIRLCNVSIVEAANVFSNSENTETIQHCYIDREAEIYVGFIKLINLTVVDEHELKVMMKKPE